MVVLIQSTAGCVCPQPTLEYTELGFGLLALYTYLAVLPPYGLGSIIVIDYQLLSTSSINY